MSDVRIAFNVGDMVTATMTTRTLEEGIAYWIVERHEEQASDGTFVTYVVIDSNDRRVAVRNGHILLRLVKARRLTAA